MEVVMLVVLAVLGCSSSREEVLDGLVVDAPEFEDTEGTEGVATGTVFELDASADPVLVFTAWGIGHTEQHGTWSRYNVRVTRPGDGLEDLQVSVLVDIDSVVTAHAALDRHLKTDDFFDVANFPTATFTSTSVVADGDRHTVTGDLTLRGTTRAVSFPATITEEGDRLRSTATIEFSRWDFGLYPADATGPGSDGVDDLVILDYDVTLAASSGASGG